MSSLVDATAALSVTDERPDAFGPAPTTCAPSQNSHSTRPSWLGRAVRNRHRHAIEQASRRWRGERRDDLAARNSRRTRDRRRFDAEPGVHIKLDKRGDGVAPVEGDTVQVNYSGRVKGKSQCRNATDRHAIDAAEPTHRSMSTQARRLNSV